MLQEVTPGTGSEAARLGAPSAKLDYYFDKEHKQGLDNTAGKALALHVYYPGSTPDIPYSPPSLPGVIPDHRQV